MFKTWSLAVTLVLAAAHFSYGQGAARVVVTGVVQDQTGAVLAGASIDLVGMSGGAASTVQSTTADGAGTFRFEKVAPGQYELRVKYEGFKPAASRVRVGTRSPTAQKLVLSLAGLSQEITVSSVAAAGEA